MQQVSLDTIKLFNQSNSIVNAGDYEHDCLPVGQSYSDDDEDDMQDSPSDVTDDENSPYFRLPYNDDLPEVLSPQPEVKTEKTLKGETVDDDGWTLTDIPEGSDLVKGDIIHLRNPEDDEPLPYNDDEVSPVADSDTSEGDSLPHFDTVRL